MAANRFKKRVKSCTCDRQTLTQAESDKQLTQWKQYAVSNKRKKNKSKKKYNAYSDIGRVSVVLIHKYSHCCKMYGCVCVPCLKWCLCVCVYCDLYVICVCVCLCVSKLNLTTKRKKITANTQINCAKNWSHWPVGGMARYQKAYDASIIMHKCWKPAIVWWPIDYWMHRKLTSTLWPDTKN